MEKRFGSRIGCLDLFLVYVVVASLGFMGSQPDGAWVYILFLVAASAYFVWRRGWIQQHQYEKEQAVITNQAAIKRDQAVQRQQTTTGTGLVPSSLYVLRITIPRVERFSANQATALIRALLSAAKEGMLELSIVGTQGEVHWEIEHYGPSKSRLTPEELTSLVSTYYPGSVVELVELPFKQIMRRRYHIFKPKVARFFDRALSVADIRTDDPLARLTRGLSQLEAGESLRYTVTIFGVFVPTQEDIINALTISRYEAGERFNMWMPSYRQKWDEAIGATIASAGVTWWKNQQLKHERVQAYSDTETKYFLEKLSQPLTVTTISVSLDTPNPERLNNLKHLYGAVEQLSGSEIKLEPGYTSDILTLNSAEASFTKTPTAYIADLMPDAPGEPDLSLEFILNLTVDEVAALWHLPHDGFDSSLLGIKGAQVPVPRGLTAVSNGILLGNNRIGVRTTPVYLPQADRTAHTAILGKPGRGKSTLMHHMLHQDIVAGRGVCLIDPTGALVSQVLQHSIPPERENDVLVLDIANSVDGVFYPPPMNVFLSGSLTADMAARRLLTVFNTIFDGFADKKMADTLNMVLMTVYLKEQPSLMDIHCLLTHAGYRDELVKRVTNPVLRDYWQQFESAKESKQASDAEPVLWRLRSFYNNERLQSITCHPNRLNLRKLIEQKKIILVSLGDPYEMLPERERFVLGAAFIVQIEMAARSGAVTDSPYLLYIDETQEFVNTSLPHMLSQLRKYGLGMVIANQYFAQLFGETFHALEGTVSTLIAFEVGKSDANALAPYMQPSFTAPDLVALGKYKAAVSMVNEQGARESAFSLETLPPPGDGKSDKAREADLRRKSVATFGLKPYDEVLAWVRQHYDCTQAVTSHLAARDQTDSETGNPNEFWE